MPSYTYRHCHALSGFHINITLITFSDKIQNYSLKSEIKIFRFVPKHLKNVFMKRPVCEGTINVNWVTKAQVSGGLS